MGTNKWAPILKIVYNFKNLLRFVELQLYLCILVIVDSITEYLVICLS